MSRRPRAARARALRSAPALAPGFALALALAGGCATPEALRAGEVYAGVSASALPNFGLALEAGQVLARTPTTVYSFEVEATSQFFDDKTFSDNGDPEAGDWFQFQGGFKARIAHQEDRAWTVGWGGVWFRADGRPNIVNEEGDYLGGYGSLGFERRISEHWSMGPELTMMLVSREKSGFELDVVPQLNWHLVWTP